MINEALLLHCAARDAQPGMWNDSHTLVMVSEGLSNLAMCTLQGNALTWWNSHVKTTTPKLPCNAMEDTEKDDDKTILPQGRNKKLEFRNVECKVKGNDVNSWTRRSTLGLNVKLTTKESLMTRPRTTRISNTQRQNTGRALLPPAGNGDRRPNVGPRPSCAQWHFKKMPKMEEQQQSGNQVGKCNTQKDE
ncbi:hypothetical protein Tco_0534819 [Tanacetum coccineum]